MRGILAGLVLFGLLAAGAMGQGTNDSWSAPVAVTNVTVIASVRIDNVMIVVNPSGEMRVSVGWGQYAADKSLIKRGRNVYTEAQIDALLQANGTSVAAMRQLFLSIAQYEASK